jgi:hypothetical protein
LRRQGRAKLLASRRDVDLHKIDVAGQNKRARHPLALIETSLRLLGAVATTYRSACTPVQASQPPGAAALGEGASMTAALPSISCFARIAAVSALRFCLQSSTARPQAQTVQPLSDFDTV